MSSRGGKHPGARFCPLFHSSPITILQSPVMNIIRLIRPGILAVSLALSCVLPAQARSQQELNETLVKACSDPSDNAIQVRDLIREGADVNSDQSYTLYAAASDGCIDILFELLQHGAIVNVWQPGLGFPLHAALAGLRPDSESYAEQRPQYEFIVRLLLKHGANVNVHDWLGRDTPLMLAVTYRNMDMVKLLLEHYADVNARNKLGQTALMISAQQWYRDCKSPSLADPEEIKKLLIAKGAKTTLLDNYGKTADDYEIEVLEASILDLAKEDVLPDESEPKEK